jgi:cytoskeleton protein RodZ
VWAAAGQQPWTATAYCGHNTYQIGPLLFPSSPEQGATAADADDPAAGAAAGHLSALGQRLRQAREARGLSALDLADRLRLGVEQLEALESADRERLPEPVFVIAQVRRVATALQLDISAELEALRASGELQPRQRPGVLRLPRPVQAAPASAAAPADAVAAPPTAPATHQPTNQSSNPSTNQPNQQPTELPTDGSDPAPQSTRSRPAGRLRLLAGAALLLLLALVWAGWRQRGTVAAGGDPPLPRSAEPLPDAPLPLPAAADSGSPASSRTASSSSASGSPTSEVVAAGMVALASREPSWVEVRRPDGAILFRGLLRGARLFSLEPGLEVMAARPDLVSSRIGSAPARTLGPISEVRWRSLPQER